jgi:hypothetical protein
LSIGAIAVVYMYYHQAYHHHHHPPTPTNNIYKKEGRVARDSKEQSFVVTMDTPQSSITLGDFLQKAAMTSYQEIKDVVDTFPVQTPLVRTERLDATVKRAKKRFAQIYAILNWISEVHVQNYLRSSSALLSDMR